MLRSPRDEVSALRDRYPRLWLAPKRRTIGTPSTRLVGTMRALFFATMYTPNPHYRHTMCDVSRTMMLSSMYCFATVYAPFECHVHTICALSIVVYPHALPLLTRLLPLPRPPGALAHVTALTQP